jgi:hypothetical protein
MGSRGPFTGELSLVGPEYKGLQLLVLKIVIRLGWSSSMT